MPNNEPTSPPDHMAETNGPERTSRAALASFVLGIASLWPVNLGFWVVTALSALVLAACALRESSISQGRVRGRTLAIVGVILALIGLIGPILFLPAVRRSRERAEHVMASNELRQLGLAVHNYSGVTDPFVSNRLAMILAESLLPDAGGDLVGQVARPWQLAEWANSEPIEWESLRGNVVFVRFWTDPCPDCARSMPALKQLADEFRGEPVKFIGVYHSKSRGDERPWDSAVKEANEWGATFPLAYDRLWKTADSWWVASHRNLPTCASFVIDGEGKIAYVHPGPEFHSGFDVDHAKCDRDFQLILLAIRQSLEKLNSPVIPSGFDERLVLTLACPEDLTPVHLVRRTELDRTNAQIKEGKLHRWNGEPIMKPVDALLIRADGKVAYEIKQGIPVMLIEQAIVLDENVGSPDPGRHRK